MCGEIAVGRRRHAGESFDVGADGVEFDGRIELRVLAADASHVEVDIHAVEPLDEPFERCGSRIVRDVDRFGLDLLRGESAQPFQLLRAASGRPDAPAGGDAAFGRFEPDARGGAHDDDPFHASVCRCQAPMSSICTHSIPTLRSRSSPSSERYSSQ